MLHLVVFGTAGGLFVSWVVGFTILNGNALPIISLLVLKPLAPALHSKLLRSLASVGWGTIVHYSEIIGGYRPLLYGNLDLAMKGPMSKGSKIVISNHICMTDALAIFSVADRAGHLGDLRFFAKRELLFTPFLGMAAYFLNFVFLSRQWDKDRHALSRVFGEMTQRSSTRTFWMVLFPEGTRINRAKLDASQAFARSRHMPELQRVLTPRSKGLVATLKALRGSVDAILDVTLGYTGGDPQDGKARPSLWELLLTKGVDRRMHVHVKVVPMEDVPEDDVALKEWIQRRFEEKDELLSTLAKTGEFPGGETDLPRPPVMARALFEAGCYTVSGLAVVAVCRVLLSRAG